VHFGYSSIRPPVAKWGRHSPGYAWQGFLDAGGSESTRLGSRPKSRIRTGLPRRQICGARRMAHGQDFPGRASKRDGQASSPPSTTNLLSTTSSISLGRLAPQPRASDAPAVVTAQRRTSPAEWQNAVRRSSVSPAGPSRANPNERHVVRQGDDA